MAWLDTGWHFTRLSVKLSGRSPRTSRRGPAPTRTGLNPARPRAAWATVRAEGTWPSLCSLPYFPPRYISATLVAWEALCTIPQQKTAKMNQNIKAQEISLLYLQDSRKTTFKQRTKPKNAYKEPAWTAAHWVVLCLLSAVAELGTIHKRIYLTAEWLITFFFSLSLINQSSALFKQDYHACNLLEKLRIMTKTFNALSKEKCLPTMNACHDVANFLFNW